MIKNIIFDLGGVILNIDFMKTMEAFRKLGISNIDEIYTGYHQSNFFDSYDKGKISDREFIDTLKKHLPRPVSDVQVIEAWNAMIIDFPTDRIELLKRLKKYYRVFLLSNTNSLHFPFYNKQLRDVYGIKDLSVLFEKTYYSFRLGMRKPDPDFFNLVITENKLNTEETFFIDDALQNVETAEKLEIKTMLYNPADSLGEAIRKNGIA